MQATVATGMTSGVPGPSHHLLNVHNLTCVICRCPISLVSIEGSMTSQQFPRNYPGAHGREIRRYPQNFLTGVFDNEINTHGPFCAWHQITLLEWRPSAVTAAFSSMAPACRDACMKVASVDRAGSLARS